MCYDLERKHMKKILIATSLLILLCISTSPAFAYTNTKYGFSIDPPPGWTVTEPSYAAVLFTGPTDSGFTVNINIQVETTTMTLDQYKTASKQALQDAFDNLHIISEGSRTINGVNAYEVVYNFTYASVTAQQKQVWLIANGKAYIVVYTAVPSTYSTYLPLFETSVQTFQTTAAGGGLTFLGLEWWIWLIIAAVIAVAAATAAVLISRRKKPPAAQPPTIQQPPQVPPPPPSP
jgi:hypothetical protein